MKDNIKIGLQEVGCREAWTRLVLILDSNRWQALINVVINLQVP
jgi:hypothetical protein